MLKLTRNELETKMTELGMMFIPENDRARMHVKLGGKWLSLDLMECERLVSQYEEEKEMHDQECQNDCVIEDYSNKHGD